ncbi:MULTISPECIES: hypothetical protein [Niastella]|uniref:Uncharacterized protein n=1 Tax=Niastella soli TaxID=2821487 RepID=A0ABS3YYN8_9BACT|nr:hypothetical protein [Niastella soli]MBO9203044.1 hypothetical protein [Niastella soli]
MRAIHIFVFIISIQPAFAQTINTNKVYQFYKSYKEVEDSIATRINPKNTIIYKICEGHVAFYLIQENSHWTGYFIKNLQRDVPLPTIIDTLENGDIVEFKPYETELQIFNADSIEKKLFQNHLNDIHQISEDALQDQLIKHAKKKHKTTYLSLPITSHDCNSTIMIYGEKNISATYRWSLTISEEMHIIPTLRIFYETQQLLIRSVKNYYQ